MTHPYFVAVLLSAILLTAAQTVLSEEDKAAPIDGPGYLLQHTLVKVNATHTVTERRSLAEADISESTACEPSVKKSIDIVATVSQVQTAWDACPLVASNVFGALKKGTVTYDFSSNGTLSSVNGSVEGVGASLITNITKFVGGALSLVKNRATGGLSGAGLDDGQKAKEPMVLQCFQKESRKGADLYQEYERLLDRHSRLLATEESFVGKTAEASVIQLGILRSQIADTLDRLNKVEADLDKRIGLYKTAKGIGVKQLPSKSYVAFFSPNDLPAAPNEGQAFELTNQDINGLGSAEDYKKAKAFFAQTGVLVAKHGSAKDNSPACGSLQSEPSSKRLELYYRIPRQIEIQSFVVTKATDLDSDPFSPVWDTISRASTDHITVVDEYSAVSRIDLPASAFSSGNLTLAFEGGALKTIVRGKSKTAAESLGEAFAATPDNLVDSYATTLGKLAGTVENREKLALAGVSQEIARLQNEQTRLTEQIETDGLLGNLDALNELQTIQHEMALIQQQEALSNAQLELDVVRQTLGSSTSTRISESALAELNARLALARAEGSYDDSLQSSVLAMQLARLEAERSLAGAPIDAAQRAQAAALTNETALLRLELELERVRRELAAFKTTVDSQ